MVIDFRLLARAAIAAALALPPSAGAEPNPVARAAPPADALVNGRWNGVDLERRSTCTRPENEGSRGTYAQFDVSIDANGGFGITQSGITGLNCTYAGRHEVAGARLAAQGNYSCTDGKQGTFQTRSIQSRGTSLEIHMAIQLSGTETCAVDAILAMARFYP